MSVSSKMDSALEERVQVLRGFGSRVVPNLHEESACNVATLTIAADLPKRSTNPGPRTGSSKHRLLGFLYCVEATSICSSLQDVGSFSWI